jgi:hypothetical protein
MSVVSISKPAKGTAVLQPNGYILYKPGRNFRGTVQDSFIVTLSDGKGGTIVETIRVKAFAAIAGRFQGLLGDESANAEIRATTGLTGETVTGYRGRISIALNDLASFSARLEVDDQVLRFKGMLTGALQFQRTMRIAGEPATLTMVYDDMADAWVVTLESSKIKVTNASSVSRSTKGRTRAGTYRLSLDRSQADGEGGEAVIRVGGSGRIAMLGVLPDGRRFSTAALECAEGAAIYAWYGNRNIPLSTLGGRLHPTAADSSTAWEGSVSWTHAIFGTGTETVRLMLAAPDEVAAH